MINTNCQPLSIIIMTKLLRNFDNGHQHNLNIRYNKDDNHNTEWMLTNAKFQKANNNYRNNLQEMFEGRLHELMGYSSHTVNDWQV